MNNKLINTFYKDYKKLREELKVIFENENTDHGDYYASRLLDRLIILKFVSNRFNRDYTDLVKSDKSIDIKDILVMTSQDIIKVISSDEGYINDIFRYDDYEKKIFIPNDLLNKVFKIFSKYEWALSTNSVEALTPDVLGHVFEKYINQKDNGAYYTSRDTILYIAKNSICLALYNKSNGKKLLIDKLITAYNEGHTDNKYLEKRNDFINYVLKNNIDLFNLMVNAFNTMDDNEKKNYYAALKNLKILDPSVGTGAFLVDATELLHQLYKELSNIKEDDYSIITNIIENNLYGVDIMEDAVEIAKVRLYLKALEYTQNNSGNDISHRIKYNLVVGNSLLDGHTSEFEWTRNFSEIIRGGGFDCVIGNPPYIEYSKVRENYELSTYETLKCGNIYAYMLEKSISLLKNKGILGFIVPISLISTSRMQPLRQYIENNCSLAFLSSFADRPASLFVGVHQKLNIIISQKCNSRKFELYTSNYYHWYKSEKNGVFKDLSYEINNNRNDDFFTKIGDRISHSIYRKVISSKGSLYDLVDTQGNFKLYLSSRLTFWVKSFISEKKSNEFKKYLFNDDKKRHVFNCIMNSSLYFFFWETVSDGWHITNKELYNFKLDFSNITKQQLNRFTQLSKALEQELELNKEYIGSKQTDYEYKHKKSKKIIDKIDSLLAEVYQLSDQEYEYIINYQLAYRMSDELENYLDI